MQEKICSETKDRRPDMEVSETKNLESIALTGVRRLLFYKDINKIIAYFPRINSKTPAAVKTRNLSS